MRLTPLDLQDAQDLTETTQDGIEGNSDHLISTFAAGLLTDGR